MKARISARGAEQGHARGALPETVEVETGAEPRNTVIWLHGLGADGHDFEPVVPMLGIGAIGATRFLFPHAPVRPVTLNAGMRMRAWYDIRGFETSRDLDEAGIGHSADLLRTLIEHENQRGIPCARIVLAGFSQGGAMALHVALRYPERLAGLAVLSAYLLFPQRLTHECSEANAGLPVFVGHGSQDPMVPAFLGRDIADRLGALSYQVSWHEYPVPHSVSQQEIEDVGAWLRNCLAA